MSREHAIQVEGTVIEVLAQPRVRVELANGHRLLACLNDRLRWSGPRLAPGDKVWLELTPFDLSKGWVIERQTELTT